MKAKAGIDTEIFVVDNNSVDGSCAMVKEKFSDIKLIENKTNTGFSKANNQAIRISEGEYVLLLNPDTLVQEDTFSKIIEFMDKTPDAGGLGVKMIDGKGDFLPESKRALPTPRVAFYKIFGLSRLFPNSRRFGKYHLTYLDKDQIHEVEILSGAFMLLRQAALDKSGLLDETFFMYGEDIDLSYRIIKSGYRNFYFPETTIIHYKGESTKKGSINYVLVFYNAMIIFARKHFSAKNAKIYSLFINLAVWLRAGISISKRIITHLFLPLLDATIIYFGFRILTKMWEKSDWSEVDVFPDLYINYVIPVYVLILIAVLLISGVYKKPVKISRLFRGLLIGLFTLLVCYSLLDATYRYSRALIVMGAAWAFVATPLIRVFLHLIKMPGYQFFSGKRKKIVIVGNSDEAKRVETIIKQTHFTPEIVGTVALNIEQYNKSKSNLTIGYADQLKEIIAINKINEIIFCAKNITSQSIINHILKLADSEVEFKIAPPESLSIIGSNSINIAGELYVVHINSIAKQTNIRLKRAFDILTALSLIIFSPLLLLFIKNIRSFYLNCFKVLFGKLSWVGYYTYPNFNENKNQLPELKAGVFSPADTFSFTGNDISPRLAERLNIQYAKNYKPENDIYILFKNILRIG